MRCWRNINLTLREIFSLCTHLVLLLVFLKPALGIPTPLGSYLPFGKIYIRPKSPSYVSNGDCLITVLYLAVEEDNKNKKKEKEEGLSSTSDYDDADKTDDEGD